jgi:hypothetical protein
MSEKIVFFFKKYDKTEPDISQFRIDFLSILLVLSKRITEEESKLFPLRY